MQRNVSAIQNFVLENSDNSLPPDVLEMSKKCLVDWFSVSLAALDDPCALLLRTQMKTWGTQGQAISLYGDHGAPATVTLVNAALSHCLDFDDMHFATAFHASGPTLSAALAVAMNRQLSGKKLLNAFVSGYEVGATLGAAGLGTELPASGWHTTGVLAHFSSCISAAALLQLQPKSIAAALGLAATQAAGLQASGGTMAKPFHVGKAAMNGVMAAELAQLGMEANLNLLDDAQHGMFSCLLQAPRLANLEGLGKKWQILGNTFKPYAACQLTHAPYEAALALAKNFQASGLKEIRVHTHPLAIQVASRTQARTELEGKFCIGYCISLGLMGYPADLTGFTLKRIQDGCLQELLGLVKVISTEKISRDSARIEVEYLEGKILRAETRNVLGSPSAPLHWSHINEKFMQLTSPIIGNLASSLLEILHDFDSPHSLQNLQNIIQKFPSLRR